VGHKYVIKIIKAPYLPEKQKWVLVTPIRGIITITESLVKRHTEGQVEQ